MKKRKWDSNDVRLWCRGCAWHRWGSQRLSPDAQYIDGGKGDYGCDQSRDNVDSVGVPESRRRWGCREVARHWCCNPRIAVPEQQLLYDQISWNGVADGLPDVLGC